MTLPDHPAHAPAKTLPTGNGFLDETISVREILFILALVACVTPWVSPVLALALGIVAARFIGNPFSQINHTITNALLQASVVGLGFGLNLPQAITAARLGIGYTALTVAVAILTGLLTGHLLHTNRKTSLLIAGGTAICGGSAIAALAPAIRARRHHVATALGTVFILNAVALLTFPALGHALHLTQHQFGLWAAMAIHDTSAVLGAATQYGPEALHTATTIKLARALWIIPAAGAAAMCYKTHGHNTQVPWFIVLFIAALALNTYLPLQSITPYIVQLANIALTITVFFIGASLSRQAWQATGWKPLLQGVIVWIVVAAVSLAVVWGGV